MDTIEIISSFPKINKIDDLFHQSNEKQTILPQKGLGSIRGVFGPMSKISFTLSNYRFVIWDKNYRRYFVI